MMVSTGTKWLVTSLSSAVLAVTLTGCGELVSGANLKPTIKYKAGGTAAGAVEATGSASSTAESATTSEGVGTIKGKVEYTGSYTPLPPLYAQGGDVKDAAVCAAVAAPDQKLLVKDGGVANVFIYLKKAPKGSKPPVSETTIFFDQKNCVFKPHALVIPVGQQVRVLNSDAIAHNTHTYGVKTTSFNSVVNPNDQVGASLIYKQAEQEPIMVVCDIHPWMRAYHLPIDHPYVALSGEDGTFEIKDLPAGKHEFKVWHESGGLIEKSLVVTVKPGDNDLSIKVSPSQLAK